MDLQTAPVIRFVSTVSRIQLARLALIAAFVALPFVSMLTQLDRPLDGDEGVYATMAQLISVGGVPYRDLIDNKPPLQYAWFSAGFALFGDRVEAMRLTTAVVMSATAFLTYLVGRQLFRPAGGLIALIAFAMSQLLLPGLGNGLPETLMLLPETAAFLALIYGLDSARRRWLFLAGSLFGLAVLTKPVAVWPALAFVPGILLLVRHSAVTSGSSQRDGWVAGLASTVWFAAGGLLSALLVLAPFALSGSLGDFADALVAFNLELSSELSQNERASRFGESLAHILQRPGLTAFLAAGIVGFVVTVTMTPWMRARHVAFIAFTISSMIGVASTGYFFTHHYVQLFPALALAIAGGATLLPRILATPRGRLAFLPVFGLFIATPIGIASAVGVQSEIPEPNTDPAYATVPAERREQLSDADFVAAWDARNLELGAYLRSHSTPDDLIHVHGSGTSRSPVYFYANRTPASRYFFESVLRVRPEKLSELVTELRETQPLFIIDTFSADYRYTAIDFEPRSAEFLALLDDEYEFVGTMYFADIYRLRDATD